jgi:DNA topoisomerase-2
MATVAASAAHEPEKGEGGGGGTGVRAHGGGRSIEELYQKKTQLEHVLLRPDTYIGSTERISERMWLCEGGAMVHRECHYVPGLYKIFDEILVNAADNRQRDPRMDTIKVDIDAEAGRISVWNNGSAVPVEMHSEEGVYVPTLIFGQLLTGSNFDDEEAKVTGGRNGFGAKLANIFSSEFTVEALDLQRGRRFRQTFRENMSTHDEARVKTVKQSGDSRKEWTKVSFVPDLPRFGMAELDADILGLMTRRVYDIAGTTPQLKVHLNGERVPVQNFLSYVKLFVQAAGGSSDDEAAAAAAAGSSSDSDDADDAMAAAAPPLPLLHCRVNDRWEVAVSLSEGQFQQVSFVNSIATTRGGTHVNHVADQLTKRLVEHLHHKGSIKGLKPFQVKNHLWLFVNCLVENPAFDSQTKCTLTTKPAAFGSSCDLEERFVQRVLRCGVVARVMDWAQLRERAAMRQHDRRLLSRGRGGGALAIPKLDDANLAGGARAGECTLILTEGDSAKALAVSGLGVVGRDTYGVFPLRGKLLNVREASARQIMDNKGTRVALVHLVVRGAR